MSTLQALAEELKEQEILLREGGGAAGKARQAKYNRLDVRARLELLLDPGHPFLELGLFAAYEMYQEWGGLPAAGVVTGIGSVSNRLVMIIGNDATVKAGAFFPQSVKKVIRAQTIAYHCRLPILYLVDSSGVFLPLQDEIFPDEDDFGRIFRNNAILSAKGIPQYAAIMGNCIAGGGYLPVLCDQLLMTEGSGLYLAGPALVKAAIGQVIDPEELGGAAMHAKISGTVDFREVDDPSCLKRLRSLVSLLKENAPLLTAPPQTAIYSLVNGDNQKPYNTRELLQLLTDSGTLEEYKKEYGPTLITAFAKIGGMGVGIVANQREAVKTGRGEVELGGVIYADSADKAARFVLNCNQMQVPLIFLQDVVGFMVGKEAESTGIIRSGAKLVNAISNSIVPKISIIVGNSFGAGHYALCGKAYDPDFIFAWPNARYAVMGGEQAASTLDHIQQKKENKISTQKVKENYLKQMDIRYGAARGWVDAIIDPAKTREVLLQTLTLVKRNPIRPSSFHTGVIQV